MDIEIKPVGRFTLVSLRGRIVDGEPATFLQEALQSLVREQKVNTVIDMENVTWFDSLGIGLLIAHYISVAQRGGQVLLLNADEKIRSLLKMCHLDDRFGWPSDLDEAAKLIGGAT